MAKPVWSDDHENSSRWISDVGQAKEASWSSSTYLCLCSEPNQPSLFVPSTKKKLLILFLRTSKAGLSNKASFLCRRIFRMICQRAEVLVLVLLTPCIESRTNLIASACKQPTQNCPLFISLQALYRVRKIIALVRTSFTYVDEDMNFFFLIGASRSSFWN